MDPILAFQVRPTDQIEDAFVQSVNIRVIRNDDGSYKIGSVGLISHDGRACIVEPDVEIPVSGLCPFLHEDSVN